MKVERGHVSVWLGQAPHSIRIVAAPCVVVSLRGYLSSVSLHVGFEIALLGESFSAHGAGEAVLFVVSSQMGLHVALLGETLPADAAGERLLLGVHTADVRLEIAFLGESLSARLA